MAEAVVAYFTALFWHSLGGAGKNHRMSQSG
jgi:hypothetical protein